MLHGIAARRFQNQTSSPPAPLSFFLRPPLKNDPVKHPVRATMYDFVLQKGPQPTKDACGG